MNIFPSGHSHGSRPRRNSIAALALASTALVAIAAQPGNAAGAVPTGGAFAAGAGTISSTANGLAINQTSARGVITWQSFSIGAGELVQFNNGAGATLNRVTGTDISTIAGTLRATGSVYLVDPYGVIVAPGGQVYTTGSFVASTRDIANPAFMAGGALEFQGTSAGTVVNQGTITSTGGDVFLIGQSVENDGAISAANGTAGLAAGDDVLIQPASGDQRIFISAGSGDATNTGTIAAAQAELNAAGGNVYALAGNTGGVISATGTTTVNGHVWLTAGQDIDVAGTVSAKNADGSGGAIDMAAGPSNGALSVSGTIDASGAAGTGGTVTMTAAAVSLGSGAVVNADGATNGGVVLIGGDRGGGADPSLDLSATPIADAQQTSIAVGALITADAGSGNGGTVVVWSEQQTDFAGSISALGGAGATGGFAEVSSHDLLGFTGTVDLLAAGGATGTLLLDPANVTISTSATSNDALASGTYSPTSGSATSIILNTDLETALAAASVVVTTTNTGTSGGVATPAITVNAPIAWTANNTLTLSSSGTITVNNPISWSGSGGLTLSASGGALNIENVVTHSGSTAAAVSLSSSTTTNLNIFGAGQVNLLASDTLKLGGTTFTLVSAAASVTSASGDYALLTNLTGASLGVPLASGSSFTGIFDGLGHTISGTLSTTSTARDVGLFSENNGGVIRNLGLTNWSVLSTGASLDVGGLVGFSNAGTLVNDYVSGTGTIMSTAVVESCNCGVGGLVGLNQAHIISSYATENVSAATNAASGKTLGIGGLVGYDNGSTISSSYGGGIVSDSAGGSNTDAGSFVGDLAAGTINADFAIGSVGTCASCNVGAFAGGFGTTYTNVPITISAAVNTKTYDGTTLATATPTVTSGSLDAGDTLTASESYASASAGTGLTLSIGSGFTVTYGSASTNYYYTITTATNAAGVINKLALTLTGAQTYNGSTSALAANLSITNLIGSDAVTLSGSATMASQNAGAESLASASGLTLGGAQAADYTVTGASGSVTVGKLAVTLGGSESYNGTTAVAGSNLSVSNLVGGDTLTLSGSATIASATVGTESITSVGGLTLGGTSSGNYTLTGASGSVTVNPAILAVNLAGSETYNGSVTVPASILAITNLTNGTNVTLSGSATLASANAGAESIGSFAGLTLGGSSAGNYTLTGASGLVTVSALPVTLTGAQIYNGSTAAAATILAITNVVGADVVTLGGSATLAAKDAGAESIASFSGLTLGGTSAGNYTLTGASGSVTVSPLALVLSGSETYNGTTAAAAAKLSAANVVGGDTLTLSGSATLASANAGAESIGSFSGLTLGGAQAADYTLTGASGSVNVSQLPVTLAGSETYNASNAVASSILSIANVIGSDTLTLSGSATLASANAGAESIASVSSLSLGGASVGNYTLTGASGSVTVAKLAVTLAGAETYTGSTGVAASALSVANVLGSDALTLSGSATLASANAGAESIASVSGLSLGGASAANYTLTGAAGSVTVSQLPVTLAGSETYNASNAVASSILSIANVIGSDVLTLSGSATLASANAGAESIANFSGLSLGGASVGNYTLTGASGSVTVAKLAVTLAGSETYTASTGVAASILSVTNVLGSDTLTLSGAATLASANAGAESIANFSGLALGGASAANYTLTGASGSVTVANAALTITAGAESKTYGQTFSSAGAPSEFAASGLLGSDSVSGVTLASAGLAATATVSGASPYALTASAAAGSGLGNYTITYDPGTLAVTPAALTITANSTSKTYGQGIAFAGTEFTTSGLVNGDSVGSVTLTSLGAPATANVAGSPYAITPSAAAGLGLGNYTITYDPGALTVNPALLTITANSTGKTYGQGVIFAGTEFTTSGLLNSDSVSSVTLTSAGAAATANVAGSPYAITPSAAVGSGLGNYTIAYDAGSLAVNPLAVILAGTEVYNATATAAASSLTVANLVGSDTITIGGTTATLAGKDVGSETITSALTLSLGGAQAADYTLTGASGSVTVTAKPLTVSGLTAATKVYDATNAATLTGTGSLAGAEASGTGSSTDGAPYSGDTVTLTGSASGTFAQVNVGTGITVTLASTLGLGGAQAADYTLVAPASLTANIIAAPLTITAGAESKIYGQTFSATGVPSEFTASGLFGSDSVSSVTLASTGLVATATVSAPASPYALTPSAATGSGLGNYTITYDAGSLAVTPAALTVTAGAESKTYGQAFSSSGTPAEFTTTGLVNGDSVSAVTLTSAGAAVTANVAGSPYALTPSAAVGSGLGNYTITYDSGALTVNQALLTITADSTSKTYGQTASFAGTAFTTSGLLNGDSVGSVTLASSGAAATAGVTGSPYALTPSAAVGSGLGNYAIAYDAGGLTVNPLAVVLAGSEIYNATATAAASSLTVANLVGSDTVTIGGTTASLAGKDVGAEAITSALNLSLGGAQAADYTLTGASGSVTVTPKPLAVNGLTVAAKVYDATNAATLSGTGSLAGVEAPGAGSSADGTPYSGDTVTLTGSASGTFTQANVGTGITVNLASTLGLGGAQAGDYTLVAPASLTANIMAAPLTITAGAESKTYGQTVSSAGAPSEFTTSGLLGSDSVSGVTLASTGLVVTATVSAPASPYALMPSAATGSGIGNYTITYDPGTLAVTPAALTITANGTSKTYGQGVTFAGTEFTTSGLVNGDSVGSVTLTSLGAGAANVAGSPYAITPSAAVGATLGNYTITYDAGSLTVNPATLTVTPNAVATTYSGAALNLASYSDTAANYAIAGFANGQTASSAGITLSGSMAFNGSTTAPVLNAGTYTQGAGTLALASTNNDYTLSFSNPAPNAYVISPAALTITVGALSKTYGQTFSATGAASEFMASGLLGSDSVSSVTLASAGSAAGANVAGSPYTLTPSAAAGSGIGNYTITYNAGSLAVNAAALTVAANNQSFVVGGATLPALTVSISGFVAGDTASVLSPAPVASTTATATSPLGTYAITVSATTDPNYLISYVSGTLSIVTVAPPSTPTTPTTPSAASIIVSTVPPAPTLGTGTPPLVFASLGTFSLDLLAQQFNAIAPAAGGNTPLPVFTPQHPGLNVVCAASGDATLTITCTQ